MTNKRISRENLSGDISPDYVTERGKWLWVDKEHYDDYSNAANCKILVDSNERFYCYSDSEKVNKYNR